MSETTADDTNRAVWPLFFIFVFVRFLGVPPHPPPPDLGCPAAFFLFFSDTAGHQHRAAAPSRQIQSPTDRPVIVVFLVGGYTPLELAEVSGVVRCAAAAAAGGGGLGTEVILAGTTVSTPDVVYEQIFTRPPAGQT